jgi:hypothetical protein
MHVIADEEIAFSPYSKSLRLASIENNMNASFNGKLRITGTLHVDFYGDEDAANGAYFLPDAVSLEKLPGVISGTYAKSPEQIFIGDGVKILAQVVGKQRAQRILGGEKKYFESKAIATIRNFKTEVICDHREYEAKVVSIRLLETESNIAGNLEPGC